MIKEHSITVQHMQSQLTEIKYIEKEAASVQNIEVHSNFKRS